MTSTPAPSLTVLPSVVRRISLWVDEHANPVLVKDIRGLLRNGSFLTAFFAGLALAQVMTFVFVINASSDASVGGDLFRLIMLGLTVLSAVLVPYMMETKFREELKSGATELALISSLTPAILIRGKIQTSVAASLVLFAAAAPSLVIGYMIGGIDIFAALLSLALLLLLTIAAAVLMIFFVTLGHGVLVRGFSLLATLLSLWAFPALIYGFLFQANRGVFFDSDEFWVVLLLVVPVGIMAICFFYTLAVSRISPVNANRDTTPRWFLTLAVLTEILLVNGYPLFMGWMGMSGGPSHGEALTLSGLVGVIFFSVGVLFLGDTSFELSRRVRADWPAGSWHTTFFYPGAHRYCAYILLHFLVFAALTLSAFLDKSREFWVFGVVISLFSLYVPGLSAYLFLRRMAEGRGWSLTPFKAMLGLNVIWVIIVSLIYICCRAVAHHGQLDWVLLLNPITAMGELDRAGRKTAYILPTLIGTFGLVMFSLLTRRAWQKGRILYQEASAARCTKERSARVEAGEPASE